MSIRLAVPVSGGGTTLQNFIDKIGAGELDASIELVIGSKPSIRGLDRAADANIPHTVVARKDYPDVASFSAALFKTCREADVDLVALGGFLCMIEVPEDFKGRVMNIHPALIPAFCGKGYYGHHVHEAVLARGAKVSGCTVHFVDDEYDHGPIIVQRTCPVMDNDTPDSLQQRVFQEECLAYPEAIRLFAEGRLEVDGRRVRIRN